MWLKFNINTCKFKEDMNLDIFYIINNTKFFISNYYKNIWEIYYNFNMYSYIINDTKIYYICA